MRFLVLLLVVLLFAEAKYSIKRALEGSEAQELTESNKTDDLCYSTRASRMSLLKGHWSTVDAPTHQYNNLSCPFEWSKYSCFHQGYLERAALSRKRHFVPDGCELAFPSLDADVFAPNRTLHFHGDSLLKQVWISMACMLSSHVDHSSTKVPWTACPNQWPCHGTANCVTCGPHSGFVDANITLNTGATLRFGYTDSMKYGGSDSVNDGDVLVVEAGLRGKVSSRVSSEQMLKLNKNLIENPNVYVVWLMTPQDAFNTPDGKLDEHHLEGLGRHKQQCKTSIPAIRSKIEWEVLQKEKEISDHLDGIIWLDKLEDQGDCKVGLGVGSHGDCVHYCQPGPPDHLAKALYTLLVYVIGNAEVKN